jgi:neutral amino acid transport system permease protein
VRAVLGTALLATLVGFLGMARAPKALAQEGPATTTTAPGPPIGVGGTIRFQGEPVEGATVTVTDADGAEIGEATTDAEGMWQVAVPAAGPYTATLDPDSLPEGLAIREGGGARQVQAQVGLVRQVAFPIVQVGEEGAPVAEPRPSGPSLFERITDRLVDGVKFGLIIAMAAIGLSLIFGTTGLINFSHGELVTFGAILAWFFNVEGPQLWLVSAAAIAVVVTAAIGGGLELGVWRPLRERGTRLFQLMVISIGLSLMFRQALLIWFGSDNLRYTDYTVQERLDWGPFSITPRDLVIMGIAVACLVGVALMLQRTRIGKAMRAVSDDVDLAESSGIDVRRVILFVWVMGAGLAGLGGVLQATVTTVNYLNGFQLLLLMFAAVILGGLGTAYGAMVGGIVVGLATEISTVWLSSELKFVWALAVLIAVLLVRPQGILGEKERVA